MEKLNKYYYILALNLCLCVAYAQETKHFFITKDTLVLENPVVISFKNIDGLFVIDSTTLKSDKKINIIKLLEEDKAFIYSDNFYRFLTAQQMADNKGYLDCDYSDNYEISHNITVRRLKNTIKEFILCFVRIDFYNEKIITADNQRSSFSKKQIGQYYKIVFPICK